MMLPLKIKAAVLLCCVVALSLAHFLPMIIEEKILELHVAWMRKEFNRMLKEGQESVRKMRMLKTLINNARHCESWYVPLCGSEEEVFVAYKALKIVEKEVFLRLSTTYNMTMFVSVFFPVVVHMKELFFAGRNMK